MKHPSQISKFDPRVTENDHDESSKARIVSSDVHWTGPGAMLGAVITAVLLSLAHHFFYQSLDRHVVKDHPLSQNQINNIATALAFLAKLMFVVASTIAYTQRQWLALGTSEHRAEQVDTLTGISGDISLFLHFRTWTRRPLLLCMAIITWSLPIAAVFTPGTLTINKSSYKNTTDIQVPQIRYDNQSAYVVHSLGTGYGGPTTDLRRVAFMSSTSGRLLTIPSQNVNQSYSLQFYAPALHCLIAENQGVFGLPFKQSQSRLGPYIYVSFVEGNDQGFLGKNLSTLPPVTFDIVPDTIDKTSNDSARVYVFTGPIRANETHPLIECQLRNATYDLSFSFQFPQQNVTVRSVNYLNPVNATLGRCNEGFTDAKHCDTRLDHSSSHMSYQAIMHAFGQIVVGMERNVEPRPGVLNETYFTSIRLTNIDSSSTESTIRGLESLFQNITLNIMSSEPLMKYSGPAQPVPVTVVTEQNIYIYTPKYLLLSYGISLVFTLFCTVIGLHAMWYNRATYQNRFSTFIRAAWHRNPNIDLWILDSDRGADPLPKGVASVKVRLNGTSSFNVATKGAESTPLSSTDVAPMLTLDLDLHS